MPMVIATEVVVIGAGPVGLYQAFQLGLLEIKCHLLDAWAEVGGQPGALYPDKPIYDIPAIPVCDGQELVQRLLTQLQPFAVPMHLGHQVKSLTRLPTNHWQITTNQGLCLDSQVVIIAAGVGAFQPKTLNTAGISDLLAQGRWAYHPPSPLAQRDPCAYGGQHIWVLGSEDDAVDDVLALASLPPPQQPASITLLHRRSVLNAPPSKLEVLSALIASERVLFCVGQIIDVDDHHVMIESPEGHQFSLPFDAGRAFLGLSPKLGPISQWGLAMTQKQLQVDPATMSTSETGIFAVGDVNTYLGKKKLLVCGFHEAVMAAFAASTLIRSHPPVLEYTSSSSRLRALLTQ